MLGWYRINDDGTCSPLGSMDESPDDTQDLGIKFYGCSKCAYTGIIKGFRQYYSCECSDIQWEGEKTMKQPQEALEGAIRLH